VEQQLEAAVAEAIIEILEHASDILEGVTVGHLLPLAEGTGLTQPPSKWPVLM